jgi:hypothetical protein
MYYCISYSRVIDELAGLNYVRVRGLKIGSGSLEQTKSRRAFVEMDPNSKSQKKFCLKSWMVFFPASHRYVKNVHIRYILLK